MTRSILRRIADNDKLAVRECLNKYGGLVWSLARRMCRDNEDAEDAVQEIFIDIWKNSARFDEEKSSETTFIAMIARRRLIDRLRKSKRRINPDYLEDLTSEPVRADSENLQNIIEAKQAAEALNDLRPEQRKVLRLSICAGLSHSEIAELTGMPIGTVKSHARRGLTAVREILKITGEKDNKYKGGKA